MARGYRLLTDEQHAYFIKIQRGKIAREVARLMNEKFRMNLTGDQIKNYRTRHGVSSGNDGRFKKGLIPHNKGKKYPNMKPNSGQFKKGNRPPNHLPVGTVKKDAYGYWKIKVADPNCWEFVHRREWEKHNGPIPSDSYIAFLDQNKDNCTIDNLALVKKSEMPQMIKNKYFTESPELTKAGIGVVRLRRKLKELQDNNDRK